MCIKFQRIKKNKNEMNKNYLLYQTYNFYKMMLVKNSALFPKVQASKLMNQNTKIIFQCQRKITLNGAMSIRQSYIKV